MKHGVATKWRDRHENFDNINFKQRETTNPLRRFDVNRYKATLVGSPPIEQRRQKNWECCTKRRITANIQMVYKIYGILKLALLYNV